MLKVRQAGSLEKSKSLKSGREVVYVGDVVGTGSSRKSAIIIQWHLGKNRRGTKQAQRWYSNGFNHSTDFL